MPGFVSNTIQAHVAYFDASVQEYKYLLLQRADDNPVYPGIWQVITGKIEENESALEAAKREIFEEIGILAKDIWTLPFVALFFNTNTNNISAAPVFATIVDSPEVKISSEHKEFEWLSLNEALRKLVLPSHKEGTVVFNDYVLKSKDKSLFKCFDSTNEL